MKNKQSNVVEFPKLKERLTEMALEAIKNKKYEQALSCFDQLGDERLPYDAGVARVMALMEMGRYEEARSQCFYLLTEQHSGSFDLIEVYLGILVHCNAQEEAAEIAKNMIQSKDTPEELVPLFEKYVHYADVSKKEPEGDASYFFQLKENNDDWRYVDYLQNVDARLYLKDVESFLLNSTKSPLLKTTLLQILKQQEIKKEIRCEKHGHILVIRPVDLPNVFEQSFFRRVLVSMESHVESENPTLYQQLRELWEQYAFYAYPDELTPEEPEAWAAALHYIGQERSGFDEQANAIAALYESDTELMNLAIRRLRSFEENVFQ
ncbi:hypothetical protein [Aureibacillus halotolerans]|uniref:Tetratricopeptide repeat protein n=1 Tax=Aureibacillus halotolerans TaxID=1508390 RepID=A0A4R6U0W7_9BACI|nr:hypothetical protein [Aureibacillus halotolerans]TDQ37935.1 hypothetical protein EV213_11113 [Aureibacillus halotolerans]